MSVSRLLPILIALPALLLPATTRADSDHPRFDRPVASERSHSNATRHSNLQIADNERHIRLPRDYRTHSRYRNLPIRRDYRGIPVYRSHGHRYPGFGFYYRDADAYYWLALTSMTLAIVDRLDESQQRLHEQAMIDATRAHAGDSIYWHEGGSRGRITVERIWYNRRGRQCRELEQSITTRYGTETHDETICRSRRGVWEVVSERD